MAEEKRQSVYASLLILLIGAWVAISPIWVVYSGGAKTSAIITGIVMALAGFVQLFWERTIPSWISALAAVWLFISAFTYNVGTGAMWSQIVSSIAVFALSYWDGFEVNHLHAHHTTAARM
jgi:hypothetical protein